MKLTAASLPVLFLLGVADAARTPDARAPQPARGSGPVRFALPNGLRVWVQEDHTRPIAVVQTTYKVGTLNEGPGTTGIAHFAEHMMYRSTEAIRAEDIYQWNDRIGGRWTGSTSLTTNYGEIVPSWAVDHALYVTAQRMGHARFDRAEFTRERNMVLTEANGFSRSDPATALRDAVMLASFQLHPYRYSSTTWAQDNLAVSLEDVRAWYKRFYGPNNAVLTVVGDVGTDAIRRAVEKHFGPLARAESGGTSIVEPPQRTEKRVLLTYPGVRQQLDMVYRAPAAGDPDYPVLAVLDRVLAGRLRQALGARGVTDLATAHDARPYPYVYRFTATTDAAVDLEAVVQTIQSEIDRLAQVAIADADVSRARDEPPQGRGGRGARGGGGGRGNGAALIRRPDIWNIPRAGGLVDVASGLTAREVFPWEVGPAERDRMRAAEQRVSPADIQRYVDRWLRPSQRTIGMLRPGKDDFVPQWSNGRAVVGERLEVPPMVTPPDARRPTPVPAQALEPLKPLSIQTARRALANGAVVRVARGSGATAALQIRLALGAVRADAAAEEATALVAARLLAGDPALTAAPGAGAAQSGVASATNDGYLDLQLRFPAANLATVLEAAARTLQVVSFPPERVETERARLVAELTSAAAGGTGRGGRGAAGPDVLARARQAAIGTVAPSWLFPSPAIAEAAARVTADDVKGFLSRHATGGAVSVSLVAPNEPASLLSIASEAFSKLRPGAGPARATPRAASPLNHPPEERTPAAGETQVTIVAALPGAPRSSADRRALELLTYIVAAPQYGGRLGWTLTRAGLAYSASATTTYGVDAGHILVNTKTDSRNMLAAIQCLRETVEAVAERGVEAWELTEAKAFTLGRTSTFGLWEGSDAAAIADALADAESDGEDVLDRPAFSRAVLGVTLAEINAAAKKYYRPERLKIVAIGALPPAGDQSAFPPGTFKAIY